LHGAPSAFGGFEQPAAGSQTPASWHGSDAVHTTGLPIEHNPVAASQAPGAWQKSAAVQMTGLLPAQTPVWQVSVWVQALPSSHAAPSDFVGLEQPVTASQTPAAWH
jgi:hypothetical protein